LSRNKRPRAGSLEVPQHGLIVALAGGFSRRCHGAVSPELARLLTALLERLETDQARLIEERAQLQDKLQEVQAEADHAKADQVRMAQDVAGMFDELRTLVERHADHAADLEQVRDELDRVRQDAGLWREETDCERARIANMQADAEHTEQEMARLRAELDQARRPWWRRLWGT
jgi:chromosome segregation ATPase